MSNTSNNKVTRVGIFYDGNYFLHVSNYYNYNHDRKRRLSIAGLHEFVRAKVAEEEGTEAHRCAIVEAKYFRGRLSAKTANQKNNRLYYDRVFSDVLMSEYVQSMHLPLRNNNGKYEEKGIDVLFAVEAMTLAALGQIDVLVLIASDGDYVPLIRKLPSLGVRTMVMSWNFEFEDSDGRMSVTRTSQDLLHWCTYPIDMVTIIEEPLEDEERLVEELFVSQDTRRDENRDFDIDRPITQVEYAEDEEPQTSTIMSLKNGFGFISYPDNNLFFYHGDVEGIDFKSLRVGDEVTFTIAKNDKGENIAKRVGLAPNPDGTMRTGKRRLRRRSRGRRGRRRRRRRRLRELATPDFIVSKKLLLATAASAPAAVAPYLCRVKIPVVQNYLLLLLLGLSAGSCAQGITRSSNDTTTERQLDPSAPAPTTDSADADDYLSLHRQQAVAKLLHDSRAPLDSSTVFGLRYFPRNDSLRITALFREPQAATEVKFPTSDGQLRTYRPYGQLLFTWQGQWQELTVYEMPGMANHPAYADYLFLPFWDETNGESTYGGGRYLDMYRSRLDAGDYTLDFNLAYNPWCAYREGYSCPVPPTNNRLFFAVDAGEAAFEATQAPSE